MKRRTKAPEDRPGAAEGRVLLRRIFDELAEDEIWLVLTGALLSLDDDGRQRLFERLHPETAAALRKVLAPPRQRAVGPKENKTTPKRAKATGARQTWERLWDEWDACVEATNDENGRYAFRERQWEQPYLVLETFAKDLEAIAAQWLPLIPSLVRDEALREFSFREAIEGLDDVGSSLPEEFLEPEEPVYLGVNVTRSLLTWEHCVGLRDGRSVFEVIDELCEFDQELEGAALDDNTIVAFVKELPDDERREILEGIERERGRGHWREALSSARSPWFKVAVELARRGDPSLHDALSRENIEEDWRLALPLIEKCLRREAYDEALSLARKAADALPRSHEKPSWNPEADLLARQRNGIGYSERGEADMTKLCSLWRDAAAAKGKASLAWALDLQHAALRKVSDGDVMLDVFAAATAPELVRVRERLYSDWRDEVFERTLEASRTKELPRGCEWVPALVDAARAGAPGEAALRDAVMKSIDAMTKAPSPKPRGYGMAAMWDGGRELGWRAMGQLLLDLDIEGAVKREAPTFAKLIRGFNDERQSPWRMTRRRWFARLGGPSLLPLVVAFWRANVAKLVPDPANTHGSHYDENAEWLAATRELDAGVAAAILARWATAHKMKSNLWKAVAARKFALPAGVRRA